MRSLLPVMILVVACGPSAAAPSPSPSAPATTPPAALPTATASPSPTPLPPSPTTAPPAPAAATSPGAPLHYVAIGASDTVGVGAVDPSTGAWPSRIAALLPPRSTYRNLGVSGSLAAQAVREQLPAAVADRPDLVTVWLAVNDLNAQVPDAEYAAALRTIVDALVKGTPARIFIGNVPDLRAVPAYAGVDPSVLLARVRTYNEVIRVLAAQNAGRVVPVDLFTGSAELMTQVTVASDGFHPSDAGYALIAQRFAEAMRKAGVPLRS